MDGPEAENSVSAHFQDRGYGKNCGNGEPEEKVTHIAQHQEDNSYLCRQTDDRTDQCIGITRMVFVELPQGVGITAVETGIDNKNKTDKFFRKNAERTILSYSRPK